MKTETKSGHKTTEFWVNLVFNIGCLAAVAFWPEESNNWIPLVAAGLSNAGYSVSRGNAKKNGG